ncbi:MAG: hypothetical protein PHQ28_06215 [Mycobacterium sp.]|nr:hypothetical protein [Mycobacterium sp.]
MTVSSAFASPTSLQPPVRYEPRYVGDHPERISHEVPVALLLCYRPSHPFTLPGPSDDDLRGGPTPGFRDVAVNVGGVQVWAHRRPRVTVAMTGGDIDAAGNHRVHDFATRFLTASNAVALNLSGVVFVSARSISTLIVTDDACPTVDLEWTLVAGQAGDRPRRILLPGLVALFGRDQPIPLEKMPRPRASEEGQPFLIGATRW